MLACLLACSLPYLVALTNAHIFHGFDGPRFDRFASSVQGYFKATYFTSNGAPLAWLLQDEQRNQAKIELFLAFVFIFLRSAIAILRVCRDGSTLRETFVLLTAVVCLLNLPHFLFSEQVRYHLIGFSGILLLALSDFALRWQSCERTWVRRLIAGALIALFLQQMYPPWHLKFPLNEAYGASFDEYQIMDLRAICRYFNSEKVSYAKFHASTYELAPKRSDNSASLAHYCFQSPEAGNDTDAAAAAGFQYLIINRNFSFPDGLGVISPEIQAAVQRSAFVPVLQMNHFVLYKGSAPLPPGEQPVANLSDPYALDAGLPLRAQLEIFAQQAPFATTNEATNEARPVQTFETRFCENPFFCSVYALLQVRPKELRVELLGRAIQVIWPMCPIAAQLEEAEITYSCDGVERRTKVANRLGNIAWGERNRALYAPLALTVHEHCAEARLIRLDAKRLELSRCGSADNHQQENAPVSFRFRELLRDENFAAGS